MVGGPLHVLEIVAPAFIIIFIGYGLGRWTDSGTRTLIKLSMGVLVPAFAWEHLYTMKLEGGMIIDVLLSSVIIIAIPGLIAWAVFRAMGSSPRGLYLPIMFMNSVNLPFPILSAAYGAEAIPYALMFYLVAFVGIFTLGLVIVSGGEGKGTLLVFKEPVIYIVILALLFNWRHIEIPQFLNQTAQWLSQATIPTVLISLGVLLSSVKVRELKMSLIAVSIRFMGGALAGIFCLWLFGITGIAAKVVILEAVMPCAVITSLVAEKYRAQSEIVASTILISTALSLFIIPLTLIILG